MEKVRRLRGFKDGTQLERRKQIRSFQSQSVSHKVFFRKDPIHLTDIRVFNTVITLYTYLYFLLVLIKEITFL